MGLHNQITLDQEMVEIEMLEDEIFMMSDCETAVALRGISKSTVAVMCATGLLSSTALESMGMESLGSPVYSEKDLMIAKESLTQTIKDKASQWSAKVLSVASSALKGIVSVLGNLWSKISESAKKLAEKSWDKIKEGAAYAKAHPYKTVLAAIGAVALVLGILKFTTGSIPGANATVQAMRSFMTKLGTMGRAVVSPFFKIGTKTVQDGNLVELAVEAKNVAAPVSESLGVLGWTKSSFTTIATKAKDSWMAVENTVAPIWDKIFQPVEKVISAVGFIPKIASEKVKAKTGSRVLSWGTEHLVGKMYYPILFKVIMNVVSVVKTVVMKVFNLIKDTFNKLTGAVTE